MEEPTIIAITGWRNHTERDFVRFALFKMMELYSPLVFRVGDCPYGVDHFAYELFTETGQSFERYIADWGRYGAAAGPLRNHTMLEGSNTLHGTCGRYADLLLGFPQPGRRQQGSGTWGCIDAAYGMMIPVMVLPAEQKSIKLLEQMT